VATAAPPPFLRLAGHPVRWQLLTELARSDLRVHELCVRSQQRQSLVSYHLRLLRSEGLVSGRRSAADGRDTYYAVDLARCGALLASAGASLHPALGRRPAGARRTRAARVLFLCTGNSARSQMAAALIEDRSGGRVRAESAGSHPKPLHPDAVEVMRRHGLDISRNRSTDLRELTGERFDFVISLCDRVREVCPEFPDRPELVHWSIPDPAREGTPAAFERTAAELCTRIDHFLQAIEEAPDA
jgi:protein-tyrosine-phosphatase